MNQKNRRRKTRMLSRLATTATPAAMKKKSPAAAQRLLVLHQADMQSDQIIQSRISASRQERTELRLRIDLTAIQVEYAI